MTTDPIVRLDNRSIRGRIEGGVAVFRGIPYAAAPVGDLRFAAPAPPTWTGDLDAGDFGPTAPQLRSRIPGLEAIIGGGWTRGDDYLNLNVWTPDSGGGLPVLVFIHGGAFIGGSGAAPAYDGARFAQHGVVLVTINYRLGVPGFLRIPGAPDNRGLLDQIAALTWVAEHIDAFGGDPGNITVFGESAGAISIGTLLGVAPAGLFGRAISQSGGASHALTPAQAQVVTDAVAQRLGVEATLEALTDVPDQKFLDVVGGFMTDPPDLAVDGVRDPLMGLAKFAPVIDGELLTEQPVDLVRAGACADVDVLVGANSEELNLYLVGMGLPATEEALQATVAGLHPEPDTVLNAYREAGRGDDPATLLSAIGTDYVFGIPSLRLAEAHADHTGGTWLYDFAWRSPAVDGTLGACHGLELPFVFDNVGRVDYGLFELPAGDEAVTTLAADTHTAWIAFATNGDPGWPAFGTDDRCVGRIDTEWTTKLTDQPEHAVWQDIR